MARTETASDAGPHGMKLPPEFGKVITLELQCVYTAWSGQWMRGLGIDGAITLTVSTKLILRTADWGLNADQG